ncbi:MAG: hypothetical protein FVQ79_07500 [Planctomycetes bacterium]|nr:hypothetical protein [Planctomycetota bacterium]
MLKLVKAVSILVVLLAAVTVATVVYFMVFGNDAVRQRKEFLNQLSSIEAFRRALDLMPESEAQVSPLVEQAHKLALRINPPKPPEQITSDSDVVKEPLDQEPEKEKISPIIVVKARSDLLATCMVADYPEKSLALISLSAGEHKWVREGDNVGHLTVHTINDGSIVFYQGSKEHSIKKVPGRKVSSLLKVSSVQVPEGIDGKARINYTEKTSPYTGPSSQKPRTTMRKLPGRPTAKELAVIQNDSVNNIKKLIKDTEGSPDSKEQTEALKTFNSVLEFLKNAEIKQEKARKIREEKK